MNNTKTKAPRATQMQKVRAKLNEFFRGAE